MVEIQNLDSEEDLQMNILYVKKYVTQNKIVPLLQLLVSLLLGVGKLLKIEHPIQNQ
jgi:hypothetical protein